MTFGSDTPALGGHIRCSTASSSCLFQNDGTSPCSLNSSPMIVPVESRSEPELPPSVPEFHTTESLSCSPASGSTVAESSPSPVKTPRYPTRSWKVNQLVWASDNREWKCKWTKRTEVVVEFLGSNHQVDVVTTEPYTIIPIASRIPEKRELH